MENLALLGVLRGTTNFIIGGDLNLTISLRKIWGEHAKQYTLRDLFFHMFEENILIDLEPTKLIPTWRNARRGYKRVSKRLDKLFLSKGMMCGVVP